MNPAVRSAIVDGLAARPAWGNVPRFRYPPGDRAGRAGFALGNVSSGSNEDITLSPELHAVNYQIEALLWVSGSGATDDDYATVESTVRGLVDDIAAWLIEAKHGKNLGVGTLDYLELASWDLSFTPEPAAVAELTFAVSEYV